MGGRDGLWDICGVYELTELTTLLGAGLRGSLWLQDQNTHGPLVSVCHILSDTEKWYDVKDMLIVTQHD